jgi:hypothetical protein
MSREAMKQALEALELLARYENPSTKIQVRKPKEDGSIVTMYPHKVATDAAAPLRERLAQPEMEPCAGRNCGSTNPNLHSAECFEDYEKSTGMNQWQGLTDEERNSLWRDVVGWGDPSHDDEDLMKAIEAKLKEKNNG